MKYLYPRQDRGTSAVIFIIFQGGKTADAICGQLLIDTSAVAVDDLITSSGFSPAKARGVMRNCSRTAFHTFC
jgi:hypothetical protein